MSAPAHDVVGELYFNDNTDALKRLAAKVDENNNGQAQPDYTAIEAFCVVVNDGNHIEDAFKAVSGWGFGPSRGWRKFPVE